MSNIERSQKFGNYRNYYTKRRNKDDNDRVNQLNEAYFKNKKCLDIGCNTGVVTIEIARNYHPQMIVGVDNDRDLIDIAKKDIKSLILRNIDKTKINSFVPRSVSGSVKNQDISASTKEKEYPHNVQFYCDDIMTTFDGYCDRDTAVDVAKIDYDTILCLNTTKWIHLYHGDVGLLKLFYVFNNMLRPTNIVNNEVVDNIPEFCVAKERLLVLEYQPWSSYTNNKNINDTVSQNYREITLKPTHFISILCTFFGFEMVERCGSCKCVEDAKGFNRPIVILRKVRDCSHIKNYSEKSVLKWFKYILSQCKEFTEENADRNMYSLVKDVNPRNDKTTKAPVSATVSAIELRSSGNSNIHADETVEEAVRVKKTQKLKKSVKVQHDTTPKKRKREPEVGDGIVGELTQTKAGRNESVRSTSCKRIKMNHVRFDEESDDEQDLVCITKDVSRMKSHDLKCNMLPLYSNKDAKLETSEVKQTQSLLKQTIEKKTHKNEKLSKQLHLIEFKCLKNKK